MKFPSQTQPGYWQLTEHGARSILVGCYTDGSTGGLGGDGINRCLLNAGSGALHLLGGVQEVVNPSYLAFGARRDVLYAVQETSDTPSVHALRIQADGAIVHASSQAVPDASPCHLSVHRSGRLLAVAAYGNGTVVLYPLDAEGHIGGASSVVQHRGRSVHPSRQEVPHAHAAVFTPDGAELFVPDLGLDAVVHPFQVLVPAGAAGLDRASKAQAEQVRTIAVERMGPRSVGALAPALLAALDDALRLHLAL